MPAQGFLAENAKPVFAAVPVNTTGAAMNSPWLSMRHYRRAQCMILTGAWAGGTPAVTIQQATSSGGAGAKTVAFTRYWLNTQNTDTWTNTAVTGNTFNLSGTANQCYVIEVFVSDLNINSNFFWVQFQIASPGANADLAAMVVQMYDTDIAIKLESAPNVLS